MLYYFEQYSFPSITPRTDLQEMNDREIATAYLLTLKRAGREYAWSAMEASNPGLRDFLKDAFTMSNIICIPLLLL